MEIGVDITAEEMIGDKWQQVFIECKASSAFTKNRWSVVLQQLKFTKERMRHGKLVFAFLGEANAEMVHLFKRCSIEVWDFEYIARRFRQEIPKVYHPLLQAIFLAAKAPMSTSPEMQLIRNLQSLKPGNADWSNYQKLIGQILERLFCPPLLTPISELSDSSKVNRRDFIVPNYSEDGFWRFIRSRYNAEYIVVDAKNYSGKIKKHSVLQISNYLKRQGAGLFGIIICRKGGDFSCSQTVREIWAIERKLVVILTDDDVTKMLTEKAFGRNPEVVIRQKIEDFRLSL
jgi:hypothetical protein